MGITEAVMYADGHLKPKRKRRLSPARGSARAKAKALMTDTTVNRRYIKRLRKLGASNYEIAVALNIPEDAPVLQENL